MKKYDWQPTKENPGRYSWMLDEIAELEGVEATKIIHFDSVEKAQDAKYKLTYMLFAINGRQLKPIKCEIKKGGIKTLFFDGFEIPFADYTDGVSIEVRKSIKEYKTIPKSAGSYKNCEGGGWYSMANLYELNGMYYTDAY